MYFIELFVKYLKKDRIEKIIDKLEDERAIDPLNLSFEDEDDSSTCEHVFMPVDSTGETFACSKCGLIISRKAYEKRNFFKDK